DPGANVRITKLLELAHALASDLADPFLWCRVHMMTGHVAIHRGLWTQGRAHEARALQVLSEQARGTSWPLGASSPSWDLDAIRIYDQIAAFQRGDFREIALSVPGAVENGLNQERIWVAMLLGCHFGSPAWLCNDDPAGFERN